MDASEAIRKRRSVRDFSSKVVNSKDIYRILEAGTLAPNSGNVQNWRFIVVDEQEKLEEVAKTTLNPETFDNVSTAIIVCSLTDKVTSAFKEWGKRYSVQNVAAAIENMLIEATGLGIDSLWVGAFAEQRIRKIFHITDDVEIHAILIFGYRQKNPPKQVRALVQAVVYFNDWKNLDSEKYFFPLSRHVDKLKRLVKRK